MQRSTTLSKQPRETPVQRGYEVSIKRRRTEGWHRNGIVHKWLDATAPNPIGAKPPSFALEMLGRMASVSKEELLVEILAETQPLADGSEGTMLHFDLGPVNPVFDYFFTIADEQCVQALWATSEEKEALERSPTVQEHQMRMWKICLQLFRCSPYEILLPLKSLQYRGATPSPVVWQQAICESFANLMTHPIWDEDVDKLVMTL